MAMKLLAAMQLEIDKDQFNLPADYDPSLSGRFKTFLIKSLATVAA